MPTPSTSDPNSPEVQKAIRRLNSRFLMNIFFLTKLPSAAFMGLRVAACDHLQASISLPFSWRSKNPFQSIYFAAQCAAAEISTGLLAQIALQRPEKISMLVVKFEAEFLKKADSMATFTCSDGAAVIAAVEKAVASGEGQTVAMTSVGTMKNGEIVSKMIVTWSFKKKKI